jgi:ABC-type antimicrobial peptide transport system permease subunit
VIASVVQGAGAGDAWLLAPLALALLLAAALVGYAVARRAARIEPIEILRSE